MAKTSRERADEARESKLEHMRQQVESGDLVIRAMTDAERAKWEERERQSPPEERARRQTALANRRRRAA
jgi:hypothetical protein